MIKISKKILETLEAAAKRVSRNAYAPYSRFQVGAALLAEDGEIYVGCNVENASFGLTNCAERSALFTAVADGRGRGDFTALMLYTPGDKCNPPCGACRQVLSEFFRPESLVYSSCDTGEVVAWPMSELLPDAFEFSTP
ncbi:cytidine deaminase [uncultured Pseudodesulfovibrio sp.]|uniref:cytidine deaminase n=1 Tax=uncultured Pseudodesulfovibrio sp. TaxID=2035858 RepID=UPI0029C89BE1|nr:cytidine deaminase [uncultured Pseudodesulfovibrio sp.]